MIDLTTQREASFFPFARMAPQASSKKREFAETLTPSDPTPLTAKTGKIAMHWLGVPLKKRKGSTPLALERRQIQTKIGHIGVNFECQVFGFLEFIRSSKGGSLPTIKLKCFCENILSYARTGLIPRFPFQRIEWSDTLFSLVMETFEDLLRFIVRHEGKDFSGRISYLQLEAADFDIHEICNAIEIHKKELLSKAKNDEEESESEFDLAQPLQISLTDPLGQRVMLTPNHSNLEN